MTRPNFGLNYDNYLILVMNGRIVLSIPLDLNNRQELTANLAAKYGADYVIIGRIFRSTITDESCEVDLISRSEPINEPSSTGGERHFEQIISSEFKLAGADSFDDGTLQKLDRCRQIVYLESSAVGYQGCLQIARLAKIILEVGGIAVRLEAAALVHSRDRWCDRYNSDDVFDIYSLFVALVEGEEYYYSCGMQQFGKADVALSLTEDINLAIYVMNVFNYYRLTESPILQDGHTFRPDIECPQYRMNWIADREHEAEEHPYNPHGRWLLSID
ncbi:MAG: hypothetical protein AAFQ41_12755 [Cyanobacteria bacterium J06623_7]